MSVPVLKLIVFSDFRLYRPTGTEFRQKPGSLSPQRPPWLC